MGNLTANDGSIERADFDGKNVTHIVSMREKVRRRPSTNAPKFHGR
jgi:hypothetical protein